MGAADIFTRLKAGGFRLRLSGETLMISPSSKLTDDLRAKLRESKSELLALLKTQPVQMCTTCRHLSRVNTCRDPVSAGLLPSFGIVWPEPNYGVGCSAWSLNPAEAVLAVIVAAGRGGWTDEQMHCWLADANADPVAVLDALRNGGPTP